MFGPASTTKTLKIAACIWEAWKTNERCRRHGRFDIFIQQQISRSASFVAVTWWHVLRSLLSGERGTPGKGFGSGDRRLDVDATSFEMRTCGLPGQMMADAKHDGQWRGRCAFLVSKMGHENATGTRMSILNPFCAAQTRSFLSDIFPMAIFFVCFMCMFFSLLPQKCHSR